MYGWDVISSVRRLRFPSGIELIANTRIQISLWPTPRGSFSVADAHAIKVSGYHSDPQNSILTDQ